ncbi:MAG: FkbM family methyltransferase [Desulfobacterales bacterium]|nr:FkbM family methyltransferase [Desulfobacterales bacterium]
MHIELFGAHLCVNKRREIGYLRAYKNQKSNVVFRDESASLLNLALILEPSDTFIDVGANVGLYSSVLSKLLILFPKVNFYAFEANPDTAKRLKVSLEERNINIFDFALSSKIGKLEFVGGAISGVFGAKANMSHFQIAEETIMVEAKTLDSIGINGDSIVLKIDVEGHEREVIQGGLNLFKANRIKAVYLDGCNDKALAEFLESMGFTLFDGQTLHPVSVAEHSLLALHQKYLGGK